MLETTDAKGRTPTYNSWRCMRDRCLNTNAGNYKYYGGRGINICKRWSKSKNFLADMGIRPPNTTLDRKNNNKNYNKSNCRWATKTEQNRSKRSIQLITWCGQSMYSWEWAKFLKLELDTVNNYKRKIRLGIYDESIIEKRIQLIHGVEV